MMRAQAPRPVLESLASVAGTHGLDTLSHRLAKLAELVRWDMAEIERALAAFGDESSTSHAQATSVESERVVRKAAEHLLATGGKRLRPICVALGARMGSGFDERAKALGVAVELVHCATLLHDDVVDDGQTRRGVPAARVIYGNAASIFGGDYLLIDALRRVRAAGVPGTLERLLDIIDEMIRAESIQLESRSDIDTSVERYFEIVDGKTAALFRWAMYAGGCAGGLDPEQAAQLERYGQHLGIAFQLIDDLLDYAGDESKTGKGLYADLREGKMTHPLLLARDRDPGVRELLKVAVATDAPLDAASLRRLQTALEETGALADTRALARQHTDDALAAVAAFPSSPAKTALATVTDACVSRDR